MCVVHWSILGHFLKELAGLVGESGIVSVGTAQCVCCSLVDFGAFVKGTDWVNWGNYFKATLSLWGSHTVCVVDWSILGLFFLAFFSFFLFFFFLRNWLG